MHPLRTATQPTHTVVPFIPSHITLVFLILLWRGMHSTRCALVSGVVCLELSTCRGTGRGRPENADRTSPLGFSPSDQPVHRRKSQTEPIRSFEFPQDAWGGRPSVFPSSQPPVWLRRSSPSAAPPFPSSSSSYIAPLPLKQAVQAAAAGHTGKERGQAALSSQVSHQSIHTTSQVCHDGGGALTPEPLSFCECCGGYPPCGG